MGWKETQKQQFEIRRRSVGIVAVTGEIDNVGVAIVIS